MTGRICGTGSAVPKLRVTNDDLSKIMDTSDEWISSRTGIKARHITTEETTTSLAVEASKKALESAGVAAEEIDMIIAATVTPDLLFPTLACMVQAEIGAVNAMAYDISAGCTGFVFGVSTAQAYIQSGMCKKVLVLGAEVLSKIMDWNDRSTCVLFGDGAGAAVICAEETGIKSVVRGSDGSRGMVLSCLNREINNPYHEGKDDLFYTYMNGQEVYKFAVRTVPKSIEQALDEAGLTADDIDYYMVHQANIRIIEAVAKRLNQSMEKFPIIMNEYGNVSAASVPILLDIQSREGKLKKGDKIVIAGFGAGLTWGAAVLEW